MADYLVLARKWRPQRFAEVLGQEHIITTLQNAIKTNKISHAYLFTGPRGIGKTSAARILAKALNCEEGITVEPCNRCASCKEINEDRSLDVLEIDGASNRRIDEIRNLRQNIKFGTSKSRYKIYIIDEVHMLTKEAFNALLKTLEEPPPHVRFIFATTEPNQIPLTILSRCQRFDFRRISVQTIVSKLKHIAQEENIQVEEGALFTIAKASQGSLRDAESIFEQLSIFTDGAVTSDKVNELLGLVDEEVFFMFINLLLQQNITKIWQVINKLYYQGKDIQKFFKDLIHFLRNLLFIKRGYDSTSLVDISPSYWKEAKKLSKILTEEQIFSLIYLLSPVSYRLKRSETPLLDLEIEMVRVLKEVNFPHSTLEQDSLEREEKTPSVVKHEKESSDSQRQIVEQKSIELEDIVAVWEEILPVIKERSASLATVLKNSRVTDYQDGTVSIRLPITNNYFVDTMERNRKFIERVLRERLLKNIKIRFVHKKDEHKKEHIIEKAIKIFDARIIAK